MNTTQLKSFAAEARKSLLSGVKSKMNALGFKDNGSIDERDYPMQAADGTLFQGEIYDVSFYGKWMRLKDEIARYGFRQVCEEGAYTWFNRLMAIQILSRNGLIDPVLEFESPDVRIPLLVKQAHEGIRPEMTAFDAARLNAVIDDDNRITDQFAILIVAYCQSTPILYKCFGTLNDFTELQLPTNILASNGFLNLLNSSTFITQDDYETTELIGWLYQFYISERKDEVFASFKKGQKANANDIPAATQIFTPNWIVKYMVQNTLGRIYLDNNPASTLKDSWQYLVDVPLSEGVAEGRGSQSRVPRLEVSCLENLTFADLSCGSGHILGEAFDLLYAIYIEEGYTRRQAIKAIFQRNLLGIDIDTRAKQLATFTLMLKACQQWADAISCEVMPRVLDMPNVNYYTWADTNGHMECNLEISYASEKVKKEITKCFILMEQAHNLGSIMKFEVSDEAREYMKNCINRQKERQMFVEAFKPLLDGFEIILALTEKYAAVVMNPPYMGSGNMNAKLLDYVKSSYPLTSFDLGTVFMEVASNRTIDNSYYAMINQFAWTSKISYAPFRLRLSKEETIVSLLDLGSGTFAELSGEVVTSVSFSMKKNKTSNYKGSYFDLKEYDAYKKEKCFLDKTGKVYFFSLENIVNFPDNRICYWICENGAKAFKLFKSIDKEFDVRKGLATGNDKLFLRMWHEVDKGRIDYNKKSFEEIAQKWIPINKGGGYRKWYGNLEFVINWENDGWQLKNYKDENGKLLSRPQNLSFMLKEGLVYNIISGGGRGFIGRFTPSGVMMTDASPYIGSRKDATNNLFILAYLNSIVGRYFVKSLCPSYKIDTGAICQIPFDYKETETVLDITKDCVNISKQDWNAHETSWDFQENELVRVFKEGKAKDLQAAVSAYKEEWEEKFNQLHDNEEELNRQFIEIYGLQDELSPDVPLEEVTILQQGEITIE